MDWKIGLKIISFFHCTLTCHLTDWSHNVTLSAKNNLTIHFLYVFNANYMILHNIHPNTSQQTIIQIRQTGNVVFQCKTVHSHCSCNVVARPEPVLVAQPDYCAWRMIWKNEQRINSGVFRAYRGQCQLQFSSYTSCQIYNVWIKQKNA